MKYRKFSDILQIRVGQLERNRRVNKIITIQREECAIRDSTVGLIRNRGFHRMEDRVHDHTWFITKK